MVLLQKRSETIWERLQNVQKLYRKQSETVFGSKTLGDGLGEARTQKGSQTLTNGPGNAFRNGLGETRKHQKRSGRLRNSKTQRPWQTLAKRVGRSKTPRNGPGSRMFTLGEAQTMMVWERLGRRNGPGNLRNAQKRRGLKTPETIGRASVPLKGFWECLRPWECLGKPLGPFKAERP